MADVAGHVRRPVRRRAGRAGRPAGRRDVGASVAVFVDGEPVVDVWGGFADAGPHDPVAARHDHQRLVGHQDDDGAVRADPRRPRRPRPGRAGRPVLAGVRRGGQGRRCWCGTCSRTPRACPTGTGRSTELYDWPTATARLAAQAPQWEPGTAAGYHSLTQGFLVGEVVRRITGRSRGRVLRRGGGRAAGRRLPHRAGRRARPPGRARASRRRGRDEDYAASARRPAARPPAGTADPGPGRQQRRLAARADPRGERIRQRPLGRPRAVGAGLRRDGARACGCCRRPAATGRREEQFQRRGPRSWACRSAGAWATALFGSTCGWGGWGGSLVMIDPDARMAVAYVTNQMRDPGTTATTGA